jgi:hypothetical protein
LVESSSRFSSSIEHDLRANAPGVCREGKPLHTFPDHALAALSKISTQMPTAQTVFIRPPDRHFLSSACSRDQALADRSRRADPSGPQFQLRGRGRRRVSNSVDGPTRAGSHRRRQSHSMDQLRLFSGSPPSPCPSPFHGRPRIAPGLFGPKVQSATFRNKCYCRRRPRSRSRGIFRARPARPAMIASRR